MHPSTTVVKPPPSRCLFRIDSQPYQPPPPSPRGKSRNRPAGRAFWHVSMMRPTIPRLPITAHRLCFVFRTPPLPQAPGMMPRNLRSCVCHLLRCAPPVPRHGNRPTRAGRMSLSPSPGRLGSVLSNVPTPTRPPYAAPLSPGSPPCRFPGSGQVVYLPIPVRVKPRTRAARSVPCRRSLGSGQESYPSLRLSSSPSFEAARLDPRCQFLSSEHESYPPHPHPVKPPPNQHPPDRSSTGALAP